MKYNANVKSFPTPVSETELVYFVIKESLVLFFRSAQLFKKCMQEVLKKAETLKNFSQCRIYIANIKSSAGYLSYPMGKDSGAESGII